MCSSGNKEYDSRAEHDTLVPALLSPPTHFGSYFSLVSQSHHQTTNPSFFDPSPNNHLHALSQPQPSASIPNPEPNCTHLPDLPPSSSFLFAGNQLVGGCSREAAQEDDNDGRVWAPPTTNAVRNSKKRSRASRRAPTTVLTTDASNFRSMVQEFTGIPALPSSASSYPRRFHPFRPPLRNLHPAPNPYVPLSSSLNMTPKNEVDAITSHHLLPDLGFASQTPLHHLTIPPPTRFSSRSQSSGSGYEPCSAEFPFSEGPINGH